MKFEMKTGEGTEGKTAVAEYSLLHYENNIMSDFKQSHRRFVVSLRRATYLSNNNINKMHDWEKNSRSFICFNRRKQE